MPSAKAVSTDSHGHFLVQFLTERIKVAVIVLLKSKGPVILGECGHNFNKAIISPHELSLHRELF